MGALFAINAFVIVPTKDREDKIRYLLNFSGIRPFSYYVGLLLADWIIFGIAISVLMLLAQLFDFKTFNEHGAAMWGMLTLFGFPYITTAYLRSFLFSKNETAFKYVILLPMIVTAVQGIIIAIFYFTDTWTGIIYFGLYTNPLASCGYAMFIVIYTRADPS